MKNHVNGSIITVVTPAKNINARWPLDDRLLLLAV